MSNKSTYKNIPTANPGSVASAVDVVNTPDVNVLNNITTTPSGLRNGLSTQAVIVTDVPTQVPMTALVDRNGISVRVVGTAVVYFGDSSVSESNGYPKFQYEEIILDITDNPAVELWAICPAGQSCELRIMQVA